ncbi:MAG: GntR family transcriptional regulator [Beijerinckiaceae bacterium]|nr:GntR family transcriptional regulator [Beijerinckiaceae bacterium]
MGQSPRMNDADSARATRAEVLASTLAKDIIEGVLVPGTRLDEHGLAERYGVSRTPVREALRQLATSGLIDMRPRRGAVVASVTKERLSELFVAMGEIEATCARLSALSMNPMERKRLQALHDKMGKLVSQSSEDAYADANRTFHLAIYEGAHNPVLLDFAIRLRRRLDPFRRAQFRAPGRLERSHNEHELVVSAIIAGSCNDAHAAMLDHVHSVEDAFDQVKLDRFVESF